MAFRFGLATASALRWGYLNRLQVGGGGEGEGLGRGSPRSTNGSGVKKTGKSAEGAGKGEDTGCRRICSKVDVGGWGFPALLLFFFLFFIHVMGC
jgi:hypothetical protein